MYRIVSNISVVIEEMFKFREGKCNLKGFADVVNKSSKN